MLTYPAAVSLPETSQIAAGDPPTQLVDGRVTPTLLPGECVEAKPCPVLVAGGQRYLVAAVPIRPTVESQLSELLAVSIDGETTLHRLFVDDTILISMGANGHALAIAESAERSPAFERRLCAAAPDGGGIVDCAELPSDSMYSEQSCSELAALFSDQESTFEAGTREAQLHDDRLSTAEARWVILGCPGSAYRSS